jgi:hypothetical protein
MADGFSLDNMPDLVNISPIESRAHLKVANRALKAIGNAPLPHSLREKADALSMRVPSNVTHLGQEYSEVVDLLCIGYLQNKMRLIGLHEIRLSGATGSDGGKHERVGIMGEKNSRTFLTLSASRKTVNQSP